MSILSYHCHKQDRNTFALMEVVKGFSVLILPQYNAVI